MTDDRNVNIIASYLVLMKDHEVLLSRRVNTGYEDGKYGLPSGHVESGESFSVGMIREAKEEINIEIPINDLKVVHILHRQCVPHEDERVETFFFADSYSGEIVNMEPEKCDDLAWFAIDSLPENTIDYVRSVLDKISDGEFYSEYGWKEE